jgi:hypothetical protein
VIRLADFIADLRSELESAVNAAPDDGLRFHLGAIELEVSVAVEKTGTAGAKANFWVVELGGDGTLTRASTQTVRLTLEPHLVGSSGRPEVSGAEVDRER